MAEEQYLSEATGGRFEPASSDIDSIVESEPMTAVEHARAYFGLAEDPVRAFGRKIDLVELSTVRNPIFRQAVEETVREIYAVA
ncbi:hypothetical protein [Methanoculleus sp.]|uniref:hypothetical protein n=1 Tax=Methanoculleus sp. TaxID=90427 RepID=UPI0025F11B78|nr:hypothetical protein [Methanoculleus sp.]